MSGSEIPSDDILRENLHKRLYIMEHESGHSFEKRFNRVGLPGASSSPISAAGAKAVVAGGRLSADDLVGGNSTADGKFRTMSVLFSVAELIHGLSERTPYNDTRASTSR
jgi:hypothetical protein